MKVPKQSNIKEENKQIKSGVVPESFEEHPHKSGQLDTAQQKNILRNFC